MRILLTLAVLAVASQANAYAAGQIVTTNDDTSKYCTDCVNFFGDLQKIVSSANATSMIEEILYSTVCSKLGNFEDMCRGFVAQLVPELMDELAGFDNPKQVCALIQMCQGTETLQKPKITLKALGDEVECTMCKMGVNELRTLLRDSTEQTAIKDLIKSKLCSIVGSFREQCKEAVDNYATMLFQLLVNELDPLIICDDLSLCTQKAVPMSRLGLQSRPVVQTKQTPVESSEECVLCVTVMTALKSYVSSNSSVSNIEHTLLKVCSYLPTTEAEVCNTAVLTLLPQLVVILRQTSPQSICTEYLGLCSQGTKKVSVPKSPMLGNNNTCIICEFVLNMLDSYLGDNKTQANVEKALDTVCSLMPDTISEECQQFVNSYGPDVINLLVQELDPAEVCKKLKLCSQNMKLKSSSPSSAKPTVKGAECVLCTFIVTQLDELIGNNRTVQNIEAILDKVCSILPNEMEEECITFINTYGPALVQLLIQELNPTQVCTELQLCGNAIKAAVKLGGEECDLCMLGASELLTFLKENTTAARIKQIFDDVCKRLPSGIDAQCLSLVNQYLPQILQIVEGNLEPREICTYLDMCSAEGGKQNAGKSNTLYFKSKLLGGDKCTYGPEHWCKSKENAVRCGAYSYCSRHVWL